MKGSRSCAHAVWLIAAAIAWSVAGGCAGSAVLGTAAIVAPAEISGFAVAYAHALCDDLGSCCQASGFGYDATNCLVAAQGLAQAEIVNPALARHQTYNPAAASVCLTAIAKYAKSCDDLVIARELQGVTGTEACGYVVGGTTPPGGTCSGPSDCAWPSSGTVQCVVYHRPASVDADGGTIPASSGSVCQVTVPGSAGEACPAYPPSTAPPAATVSDCGTLASAFDCVNAVCAPRGAVGATCVGTLTCEAEAYCSAGTCAARIPAGSPCDPTEQGCVGSAQCDFATSTCVPLLATGEPCQAGTTSVCLGECDGTACRASSFATANTCGG